jgi:hypothetical protein
MKRQHREQRESMYKYDPSTRFTHLLKDDNGAVSKLIQKRLTRGVISYHLSSRPISGTGQSTWGGHRSSFRAARRGVAMRRQGGRRCRWVRRSTRRANNWHGWHVNSGEAVRRCKPVGRTKPLRISLSASRQPLPRVYISTSCCTQDHHVQLELDHL